MSRSLLFICTLSLLSFSSIAQNKDGKPLLDGTIVEYTYQNGDAAHVEFAHGQFNWKWILGSDKGSTGSAKYMARKIGDKIYMINFKVAANSNFVTIVFNFNRKVLYASALFDPKTKNEQIFFESGVIKQLKLKEN